LRQRFGVTISPRPQELALMARSFGQSSGSMTTTNVTTNVNTLRAVSQHETTSIACAPAATLYRLAFLKPALGNSCRMTTGDSQRIEACVWGAFGANRGSGLELASPPDSATRGCAGWFKTRGYRHFDAPVGIRYGEHVCDLSFVEHHSWLPLIHYVKRVKRYKNKGNCSPSGVYVEWRAVSMTERMSA
jgi:hypothetical protein